MTDTSGGHVERRGGFKVLHIQGSPYEMGLQHGRLLREEIREGVLPYFADLVEYEPSLRARNALYKYVLSTALDLTVYRRLIKGLPRRYRDELHGIADGAGLPRETVLKGNQLSELGQVMARRIIRGRTSGLGQAQGGCTGFVASARATGGPLLQAKNQDYEGIGLWDRHPIVIYCRPDDAHAYVKVTSAGLLKSPVAMNEHGLALGGHLLVSSEVSTAGRGFTTYENDIMRYASSVAEAVAMLEECPRVGAFAFLVSDGKTGEAAAVECMGDRTSVRYMDDGFLVQSNVCTSGPEVERLDLLLKHGMGRNPIARQRRMEELMREHFGTLDPQRAAVILGDHYDPTCDRERAVSNVIAQINTVTSAVFQPEKMCFWAAAGPVPVSNNPYVFFDFHERGAGESLDGNAFRHSEQHRGLAHYRRAAYLYETGSGEPQDIVGELEQATAIDPDEPVYLRMLARFHARSGKHREALEAVRRAEPLEQNPNERAENLLLKGQLLDLQGKRAEAVCCYTEIEDIGKRDGSALLVLNPLLLHRAAKLQRKPFARRGARSLEIKFSLMTGYE